MNEKKKTCRKKVEEKICWRKIIVKSEMRNYWNFAEENGRRRSEGKGKREG